MRYAIYDESGELIRRYPSSKAQKAKAHGALAGCRLELIKRKRGPTPYQKARAVAAKAGLSHWPF